MNQANNDGDTPLYVACEKGHAEVVTTLLDANADKNQADNDGDTPLYVACQKGHTEVVTTLLDANADKNQANNDGGRRCTSPATRATPRSSRSCSPRTPT